jgi:hypothetical protein
MSKKEPTSASLPVPTPAKTPSLQSPLEAAYAKFMQTRTGASEHERAGDELVDLLFADAK